MQDRCPDASKRLVDQLGGQAQWRLAASLSCRSGAPTARRGQAKAGRRKLGQAFDGPLGKYVLRELPRALSPEQIAGRLKRMHRDDLTQHVLHELIYQSVYMVPLGELRTQLIAALRRSRAKRMPRARGTSRSVGNVPNLVPLSERPAEVDARAVPAYWEDDFIKGASNISAIGTAVERHSRYVDAQPDERLHRQPRPRRLQPPLQQRQPQTAPQLRLRPRQLAMKLPSGLTLVLD